MLVVLAFLLLIVAGIQYMKMAIVGNVQTWWDVLSPPQPCIMHWGDPFPTIRFALMTYEEYRPLPLMYKDILWQITGPDGKVTSKWDKTNDLGWVTDYLYYDRAGTWKYKVTFFGDEKYAGSTAEVTITVLSPTGDIYLISVTPDKTTVVLGEQVVFTGELTHVYGTATPVAGAGISLNYYVSTDPWHTVSVGSATTDSEGKYAITWVADKVGDLTFFVRVPQMGSLSPFADCYVTVKESQQPQTTPVIPSQPTPLILLLVASVLIVVVFLICARA
jgi:hypothetical protein